MLYTPDKVIQIATNEIGYLEKSKSAYKTDPNVIYSATKGAGQDNITKYNFEMHKIYPAVMDFPAAWCAAFVDWCFYKAYGVATAESILQRKFEDYTVAAAQQYMNKKAWYKSPQYGDQIFFKNSTRICHTGLVYNVDNKCVYTIEGNTSNKSILEPNGGCVAKKKYLLSYSGIAGYGRPKYDLAKETTGKTVEEVALEVLKGQWGVYPQRKIMLEKAGYNYEEVRKVVNALAKK